MMCFKVLWLGLEVSTLDTVCLAQVFKDKVCVIVVYGQSMRYYGHTERDDEEREKFWNDFDRVLYRIDNGYRGNVMGELNVCENENVRRRVDLSTKRHLWVIKWKLRT